jgi:hypothetical protein
MPVAIWLEVIQAQRQVNATILLLYQHLGRYQELLTAVQAYPYLGWIVGVGREQSPA